MQYEDSIRQDHIIVKYLDDTSKPLFAPAPVDELKDFSDNSVYYFRAGNIYFQKARIKGDKIIDFDDFFLKGVNLGVAVPGKFPAEFSLTFKDYLDWIHQIGQMNANIIRTYTILPPEFYKALSYYNLHHADRPVFLLQGIWATVPKDEDYFNSDYIRQFKHEIIDAIDVIHGNTVLKKTPGKAHGIYTADVSKYVAGYLLGREWEPRGVFNTVRKHTKTNFAGNFVQAHQANAMEVWLAQMLDFTATYETQAYQWQHPLSFVNWLPLDPMYHNTEFIEKKTVREYDNDLNSIDFTKFQATDLLHTGLYAAYHAYPYYPDFIYLQKNYKNTTNEKGEKDHYLGYLKDLKNHCKGMPLVIAEYGLPSSRGISHFTPDGLNQGGHSEAQQAKLSKNLTKDIVDSQCAGAVYFEWADEWFKHNWLVMDFELPFENRKLWHNMENPEQNFGIIALEDKRKTIDGDLSDWKIDTRSQNLTMQNFADATYFYTAAHIPGFDFSKNNLYIAIDTYDKEKGDHKLPFSDKIFNNGFEFLLKLTGKNNAEILVDEPYSVFTDIYNNYIPVYASKKNQNGKFISELMLVNRGRESLTGEKSDSLINNRGILSFGKSDQSATSNADWFYKNNNFELRIDWHLINISDPSHKYVLDDKARTRIIEYSQTEGINSYLFITDKQNHILEQFPKENPLFYSWDDWHSPVYTQRRKVLYDTLQQYFSSKLVQKTKTEFPTKEKFEITDFYMDKKAAVSISFDEQSYSQYLFAYPELKKYGLTATFGLIPGRDDKKAFTAEYHHITDKRMGKNILKLLQKNRFEMAITLPEKPDWETIIKNYSQTKTLHTGSSIKTKIPGRFIFVRQNKTTQYKGVKYHYINSHTSPKHLWEALMKNSGSWSIVNYKYLFKDSLSVKKISKEILAQNYVSLNQFKR